ncbi:methyltransferase domain-containing protein [Rhodovibrionaceae bacterium A322]
MPDSQRLSGREDARELFDPLADHYHLLFDDWQATGLRQAEVISELLADQLDLGEDASLLDATCGIGTQALGLADLGHDIALSDLSEAALSRALMEGEKRGHSLDGRVCDVQSLTQAWSGRVFDAVLLLDNALPNLMDIPALQDAMMQVGLCLKPGGWIVASMRDYDSLLLKRDGSTPLRVIEDELGKRMLFQTWDWLEDEPYYRMTQYLIFPENAQDAVRTLTFQGWFRAFRRREVNRALRRAGFENIAWLGPKKTKFFQPILIAQLPSRMHG